MTLIRRLLSLGLALFICMVILDATVHPWPNPDQGEVLLFDLPGENTLFVALADKVGLSAFEPLGRVIFACLQLLVMVLLILPFSRRVGAGLSSFIFAAMVGGYGYLGGSFLAGDIYLALACLTASCLIILIHPRMLNTLDS